MPERRPHMPNGVKLQAALLALGFTEAEVFGGGIDWDHNPPLALRLVDPVTGKLVPAANDPRYITPLAKRRHAVKTNGTAATTAGSDKNRIAKVKRLEKKRGETGVVSADDAYRRKAKPKRKIPSRPFAPRRPKELR